MEYEVVIGLEVHVELTTESKLFCSCSAKFGAEANENVCPACAGMPGMLPAANRKAIELGIAAGLVTNSRIAKMITFDKKNYFYPDLPAGYQTTQFYSPICFDGYVDIETGDGQKRIRLKQIHIEEDAGKLVHDYGSDTSLIDFNRACVPLIEIVSKPDFRSADEVVAYLEKLRTLLTFANISDCRMQEGSMRCDVNISVRKAGTEAFGTRTEIKNLNSLRAIARAVEYEAQRHIDALETGSETLVQETRRWDDNAGQSFSMRSKEDATDYRYFPDPDILPICITDDWVESIRESLPESAADKYIKLTERFGLPEYDSRLITGSKKLSDIFDAVMVYCQNPKDVANWIITDLLSIAAGENKPSDDIDIDFAKFAKLINMVSGKIINRTVGKKILMKIYEENIDPEAYAAEHKLGMIADTSVLERAVQQVLAENEKSVAEYKAGNQKVFGFLMGKAMGKTGGKADPGIIRQLLQSSLNGK